MTFVDMPNARNRGAQWCASQQLSNALHPLQVELDKLITRQRKINKNTRKNITCCTFSSFFVHIPTSNGSIREGTTTRER